MDAQKRAVSAESVAFNTAAVEHDAVMAAVDLGSNSFHLLVAHNVAGQITVLDRVREPVRLAAGLTRKGNISATARKRALAALRRFGQRLHTFHASRVHAVGTNTLRKAKNAELFLEQAEAALGHPIEVIAGREEARLIYLGAAHSAPEELGNRLVLDIGGGSTELIVGEGLEIRRRYSLYMGCVSYSRRFFPEGRVTRKRLRRARLAVELELEPVLRQLRKTGWQHVVGCSGTIRAAQDAARELGLVSEALTGTAMHELVERLADAGDAHALALTSVSESRLPVLAGGLVILGTLFETLEIDRIRISDGALREGLLYDMLGRLGDEDARVRSVRKLSAQFLVDPKQARRVAATAATLHAMVADDWNVGRPIFAKLLNWAAQLHEIGLKIAHAKYHKHGAYVIENADLRGFTMQEQRFVALLVGSHRRKILAGEFANLPKRWRTAFPRMLALLRLAVLLHRSRSSQALPAFELTAQGESLQLTFPAGWLHDHPLTAGDLELEVDWIPAAGITLRLAPAAQAADAG